MDSDSLIEAAALAGRQQAFAVVASHALAARAQSLRQIRDSRAFEAMGLTWDDFCTRHAGISRVYADRLIARLDEFGESYFKLSQVARVSPETYRQIAGHVHEDVLTIDGDSFPLTPENAPRIRTAIRRLKYRMQQAEARSDSSITELRDRLDAILREISRSVDRPLPIDHLAALRGLSDYAVSKWRALVRTLEKAPSGPVIMKNQ